VKNKHVGQNFDDFLRATGDFKTVDAAARKRIERLLAEGAQMPAVDDGTAAREEEP
jgi:hypothetical protein